jgi:E3 ubiquitin-protein ligase RFWD2
VKPSDGREGREEFTETSYVSGGRERERGANCRCRVGMSTRSQQQQQRAMTASGTGRTTRATAENVNVNDSSNSRMPLIHVLVVDDERICRAVTSQVLRKCGYRVTTCASGAEAIELLRRGTEFNLLLTDVMMPDIDGPKLLQHVRHHSQFSQLPVIMMSANQHSEIVFECVRSGADDYLLKPVTVKQVKLLWQHVWRKQYTVAPQTVPRLNEYGEELDEDNEEDGICMLGKEEMFQGVPNVPRRVNSESDLFMNSNGNSGNNNNNKSSDVMMVNNTITINNNNNNSHPRSLSRVSSRENFLSMQLLKSIANKNISNNNNNNKEKEKSPPNAVTTTDASAATMRKNTTKNSKDMNEDSKNIVDASHNPRTQTRRAENADAEDPMEVDDVMRANKRRGKTTGAEKFRTNKDETELILRDNKAKMGRRLIQNSSLVKKTSSRCHGGSPSAHHSSPSSLSSHDDSNFVLAPPIQGLEKSSSFVPVRNWLDSNAFRTMNDETKFHVLARTAALLANDHERGFCSGGVNPSRLLISPQGDIKALDEEEMNARNNGKKMARGSKQPPVMKRREVLYETLPSENELPNTIKSELVSLGALVSEMFWKDMFDAGSRSENPRAWFNEKELTHIDELHPEMAETFRKLVSRDPRHRISAQSVRDIALKQLEILRDRRSSSSSSMPSKAALANRELNVDSERKANELKTIIDVLKSIEKSRKRDYEKTQRELNVLMALSKLLPNHSTGKQGSATRNNAKRKRGVASNSDNNNNDHKSSDEWARQPAELQRVLDHVPFDDLPKIVFESLEETLFQAYAKSCKTHALQLARGGFSGEHNTGRSGAVKDDEKWISNMIKRTNVEEQLKEDLKEFGSCLTRVTRKWRFRVVARLGCGDLVGGSSDMVCSTAWNRDGDLFATAGISKRLCIYEVASVMQLGNAVHCPAMELSTSSKLSSISFNPYVKPVMASATYDGAMQIWDVQKGMETMRLKNHTKRVWSTEFSPIDPTRLLSASDDSTTRVWSITQRRECMVINDPNQANICSVNSSRMDSNLIAVGSADHKVHVYDLRNAVKPMLTLETHKKAVSYVKWMGNELVSASTDSLLRLWDVKGPRGVCLRTYTGHVNEKNFVGLSVTSDGRIACGSEDNTVRMYAKFAPLPVAGHSFMRMTPGCGLREGGPTAGLCGGIKPVLTNDKGAFVTSVAWSPDGQRLLASNSRGNLKIFELD